MKIAYVEKRFAPHVVEAIDRANDIIEVHVGDANQSRRVQRFFAAHPRASFAIVGNIKRINAILKQTKGDR